MVKEILNIAFALIPVVLFLASLVFFDSYKLVSVKIISFSLVAGIASAGCALIVNQRIFVAVGEESFLFPRYIAPLVEEFCKSVLPIIAIRRQRVGFMVDAAILGFTVGTGFALVENIYYLSSLPDASLGVWLVRGFGTAVMHGGTTGILAVIAKNRFDTGTRNQLATNMPAFLTAVAIHSFFNHFLLPPLYLSLLVLVTLPVIMALVFERSERVTRSWLGVGFDADAALLNMIISGDVASSRIGNYLRQLQERFRPEVVVDLLCYLRLYLELAVQAKGIMLMRESGFEVPPDPEVEAKFIEMKYLERSIGKTGYRALTPFIHTGTREIWQLHMLRH